MENGVYRTRPDRSNAELMLADRTAKVHVQAESPICPKNRFPTRLI